VVDTEVAAKVDVLKFLKEWMSQKGEL
jgi:hypothetical protein